MNRSTPTQPLPLPAVGETDDSELESDATREGGGLGSEPSSEDDVETCDVEAVTGGGLVIAAGGATGA